MSDLTLSRIILGSMSFSEAGQERDIPAIHAAIDHGITTIDTAPLYGAGQSEIIIGRAIADRRDRVQLLTKCGLRWDTNRGRVLFSVERDGKRWEPRRDSRPESIIEEVDLCLQRLKTDYIDLMQVHHLDYDTPVEETMDALERARLAGKIRAIGVSNYPVAQLERAANALPHGLYSTQNLFNLLRRDEAAVKDFARSRGIAFLAYTPLAEGVLAGRFLRAAAPRAPNAYKHPRNLERVHRVLSEVAEPLAKRHHVTLAQLTLLWTLSQPGVTSVIIGGRRKEQLLDSAGALQAHVPLDELRPFGEAMAACGWDPSPQLQGKERLIEYARRGKRKLGRVARALLKKRTTAL